MSDAATTVIDIGRAYLVGSLLEAILYGMLCNLLAHALHALTVRRSTPNVNYIMIGSALIMWAGCTIHIGIAIRRCVQAFVDNGGAPGGSDMFLMMENAPLWLASEGSFICVNAAADLLLAYRCYLIWDRNFWIVIPALFSITGSVVAAIIALVKMAELQLPQTIGLEFILQCGSALFSMSLITNVTTTALITFRIFWLMHTSLAGLPESNSRKYVSVVEVVVESGALMAITQAVFLGLWQTQNNVLWALYGMLAQIMAISPMLIIVRSATKREQRDREQQMLTSVFGGKKSPVFSFSRKSRARTPAEPPHILTHIETHRDMIDGRSIEEYGSKKGSEYSVDGEWQA
ncbi:hypothetical protein DACRYDRAFT_24924 [Dacryopinax primogenitus]|uniref:Uncharacterized protein n=1 Tax=Dacryopinax primogenitus (strain DJM 731) TaxID=1858805 RepID=M5G165_DACPD|nr:uncharacterized protein DACRYDRAFT_24924 [Dacryopinax primogenitus]EJT97512.1 hypothetical protein DACRYDRAFT_24924 [Dacryopinax primogenitus]